MQANGKCLWKAFFPPWTLPTRSSYCESHWQLINSSTNWTIPLKRLHGTNGTCGYHSSLSFQIATISYARTSPHVSQSWQISNRHWWFARQREVSNVLEVHCPTGLLSDVDHCTARSATKSHVSGHSTLCGGTTVQLPIWRTKETLKHECFLVSKALYWGTALWQKPGQIPCLLSHHLRKYLKVSFGDCPLSLPTLHRNRHGVPSSGGHGAQGFSVFLPERESW